MWIRGWQGITCSHSKSTGKRRHDDNDNKDDFPSSAPKFVLFAALPTPPHLSHPHPVQRVSTVGRSVVGGDFCACHIHRHWLPQSESSTHPPTPHHLVLTSVHVASCSFPTLNIHSTVVVVVLPVVVIASPSCRVGPVGRGVYTRAKQRAQQVVGFRGPFPFQPPTPFSIRRGRRESPFPTPLSHFITCTLIRPHSLPLICRSVGRLVGWSVRLVLGLFVRGLLLYSHTLCCTFTRTHIQ